MRLSAFARVASVAALLVCTACPGPSTEPLPSNGLRATEMRALERLVAQRVARGRAAWRARNPLLLVSGPDSAVGARRPDGTPITNAQIRADLARRMAVVVRLDTLNEVITGVRPVGDSVEVTTRQRFVRMVRVDGTERVRVSGVTHRQWFRRERGAWIAVSPLQESDQEAYWADERPRG
jgi:cytochrome c biogenesis protein ResB